MSISLPKVSKQIVNQLGKGQAADVSVFKVRSPIDATRLTRWSRFLDRISFEYFKTSSTRAKILANCQLPFEAMATLRQ